MARDEYYEMKDLAKQKAREEDQQAMNASTAPKPKLPAMTAGMGDVRAAERARGADTPKLTKMESFAADIEKLQRGQGRGYRVQLDDEGLAAVKASREYATNPAAALQREMEKMAADPTRNAKAVTAAFERQYGLPAGRYGADAADPGYFEKVKRDPDAMKLLGVEN